MFNVSRRKIYDIERKSELRNKTVLIFKTELYIIFISNVYDVEIYGRFGFFGYKNYYYEATGTTGKCHFL